MKIKFDSKIEITHPNEQIIDYCNSELTLKNPEIQKKKAMGFWTGNLKKKIYLYTRKNGSYILPMGCLDDVWRIHPYLSDYVPNLGKYQKIDFPKLNIKLYDYQKEAVENMIKYKRGILQAPCGSGKSICAVEITRRIGFKTLVVVQTMEILNQFKDYFLNVMELPKEDIGIIAAGKVEIGSKVTLALRQTLCNIDLIDYKYEWGTIILDECQNICSSPDRVSQYEKILNNIAAEYRIALSATPERMDGMTKAMLSLCGKVKHIIPLEAVADKTIKAKIKPVQTNYKIPEECLKFDGTIIYPKLSTNLAEDEDRNNLILKFLEKEKNNYCLILSDRLSGLRKLQEKNGGLIIDGSMTTKKAKQERAEAIEKMRNKKEHFLFATYSLAREGLDIKPLNRLFLIAPTKNKTTLIQSVGRIERKDDNKEIPIVYDFIDNDIYFIKSWKKRKNYYKKNNNEILDK